MAKSHLRLVTPATVKRTVTPRRLPNGKLRTREYLTPSEVEDLMAATKGNRWGHRDATMVLVAYSRASCSPARGRRAFHHGLLARTVRYTELSPTRFKDFANLGAYGQHQVRTPRPRGRFTTTRTSEDACWITLTTSHGPPRR